MLALLDCSRDGMASAADELPGLEIGQLLTPLTRRADLGLPYGIDNGAFAKFDPKAFRSLIERQLGQEHRCLFVAVPDIVGSARRTLEVFKVWYEELSRWPVALVAQDGIEDLEIPWDLLSAVFIGGSTEFKSSREAVAVAKAAKALSLHVHVGRVNTRDRLEFWAENGADSIDGTGISRYSHMRAAATAPGLFTEGA